MNFDEYQKKATEFKQCPEPELIYLCLGLAGETGEFVDKIKKLWRNKGHLPDISMASPLFTTCNANSDLYEFRIECLKELGDILWYISQIAEKMEFNLSDVANENINKLRDRADRHKIKGEGDNR